MLIGKPEEKSQGINLKLSFPDSLRCIFLLLAQIDQYAHKQGLSNIIKVSRSGRLVSLKSLEGIGIAIDHDKLGLGVDEPLREGLHVGALGLHADVRQELVGGVS